MGRGFHNYSVNGWTERKVIPAGAPKGTRVFDKKLDGGGELVVTCSEDFAQIAVLHHATTTTEVCDTCGGRARPEEQALASKGETVKHGLDPHVYVPRLIGGRMPTFPEVLAIVNHFGRPGALYATMYAAGAQVVPIEGPFPPDNAIAVQQIGEGRVVKPEPLIKVVQ